MRKAKTDANQQEIVGFFRLNGFSVAITSAAHDGFPDLVIGFNGITVLVEVKDGSLVPSKRRLTPKQIEFHNEFKGAITVVESIEQAAALVKKVKAATGLKW
ncbi:hypothetical protein [Arsukibacterium sp.]|uniref:hypothetical protein n=1 Tax=Arsukibacterium sp. TaxID=1977258 RepID=UPI002FDAE580